MKKFDQILEEVRAEMAKKKVERIARGVKRPMTNSKPELMRQIADAMERNPDGWWREFEVKPMTVENWSEPANESHALNAIAIPSFDIRPRPRTVRIDVEVPEPMREVPNFHQDYWVLDSRNPPGTIKGCWFNSEADHRRFNHGIWPTEHEAQQAADAIFGALGRTEL